MYSIFIFGGLLISSMAFELAENELLTLNFQDFTYIRDDSTTMIGIKYGGSCKVKLNFFEIHSSHNRLKETPTISTTLNGSSVLLSSKYHSMAKSVSKIFQLVAENENGTLCSDETSRLTFYKLERPGIATWRFKPHDTIKLPIPRATECNQPVIIWPKKTNSSDEQCQCVLLSSNDDFFAKCAQLCVTDYNIELQGDSVLFHDLSYEVKDFIVHFLCDQKIESTTACTLRTFLSSHHIKTEDPSDHQLPLTTMQGGLILIVSLLLFLGINYIVLIKIKQSKSALIYGHV